MKQVLIGLVIIGAAAAAVAQAPPSASAPASVAAEFTAFVQKFDKNGDNLVSKEELAGTPVQADFEKIDANKDGQLTAGELELFVKSGGGPPAAGGATPPAGGAPPAGAPPTGASPAK